jgi:two-component system NarL family response regulator
MKILIADDCSLAREGLRSVLREEPDMQIIGEAGKGEAALALAGDLKPDVILFSRRLGDAAAWEITKRIRGTGKLIIIDYAENAPPERVEYAAGYWAKESPAASLPAYIRQVKDRRGAPKKSPDKRGEAGRTPSLTAREEEIFRLLSRGLNNKEIAKRLFLSEKTVKNHLTNIFKKLKVHNRVQAVLSVFCVQPPA